MKHKTLSRSNIKHQTTLIIEHCEPELSTWLLLEYQHCVKIWEKTIVFTRVHDKKSEKKLTTLGIVEPRTANEMFAGKKCIILDPLAKKPLTTRDFEKLDGIIIGGILGYKKPRGRTKELITKHSSFESRHLGKIQLTIDSAVFVAKAIMLGMKLSDIEITTEVEIVHNEIHSTILPFGYPILNNTVIFTPGLIEYLQKTM
ncbi:MAG: hypothetical protein QXL17_07010 [Candidatus Thermoplasmatota archaeon]